MQQQRTTKERLLSSQDMPISKRQIAFKDIERTLFFVRMAQLHLNILERSKLLHDDIRDGAHKAAESIRGYDQKLRHFLPEKESKSLTLELSKEKIYDFSELMETLVKVKQPEYEDLLQLMVNFITLLVDKKLKTPEYTALMKFLLKEIQADSKGAKPGVIGYDEVSQLIIFKLENSHETE